MTDVPFNTHLDIQRVIALAVKIDLSMMARLLKQRYEGTVHHAEPSPPFFARYILDPFLGTSASTAEVP
jgi:hypothetical protein